MYNLGNGVCECKKDIKFLFSSMLKLSQFYLAYKRLSLFLVLYINMCTHADYIESVASSNIRIGENLSA